MPSFLSGFPTEILYAFSSLSCVLRVPDLMPLDLILGFVG